MAAVSAAAAFCGHDRVRLPGAPQGALAGLTFAAKDLFDVQGVTACCGNPTWLATHAPAVRTAPAVVSLLDAGATLVGLTLTDELALSLTGENAHYGTPINARCPDRVPGGSSSGSAAAVASGLADLALGTDTGGSVRVPASHCGLYGFRPTHGAVSTEGVWPLAPRFDTVGWFARDAGTLARAGDALLPAGPVATSMSMSVAPRRLLVSDEAAAFLEPEARDVFARAASLLAARLARDVTPVVLGTRAAPADGWRDTYLALQNAEAAALHGDWIARHRPRFGSLIKGRFARALAVTSGDVARAETARAALVASVNDALGSDAWLIWPSAAGAAPRLGLGDEETNAVTGRALALGALAGLAGLPQVSLPLGEVEGCPFGISLIAPRGADRALLAVAAVAGDERTTQPGAARGRFPS